MTLQELGYEVGFIGEDWCVIQPDGSYAVAIDSDVNTSDDIESAFGGLPPEWTRTDKAQGSSMSTEDIFKDTKACTVCGQQTAIVDIFPKGLCPTCYRKKMDAVPLDQIPKPDFRKVFRKKS